MQADLWKASGHSAFYGESMFGQMQVEGEQYQLRPMNCPFHIAVFKVRPPRMHLVQAVIHPSEASSAEQPDDSTGQCLRLH